MCSQCGDSKDTSDKDSPNGIILSYTVRLTEQMFKLPHDEFVDYIDRQLAGMTLQLKQKAQEHWLQRDIDKDFPTEFTGM